MIGASTLIIDDKQSDGVGIAQALWQAGINCCFVQYKEEILSEELPKHSSVRIIFQDINLVSSSTPSVSDFDQAVQVIDKLLYDDNGPWILATWSTWEDQYATELFEHLKENLPEGKRPVAIAALNKEEFTDNDSGPHGEVRSLSDEDINKLVEKLGAIESALPRFYKLAEWERASLRAAQKVIHDITSIPSNMADDFDSGIAFFLNQLGVAGSSESSAPEERCQQATAIINSLVSNEVEASPIFNKEVIEYKEDEIDFDQSKRNEWARRSSRILHFDLNNKNLQPGAVYSFKKPPHYYSEDGNLLEELQGHYSSPEVLNAIFDKSSVDSQSRRQICSSKSKLVLIDITPPCDHANLKAHWRKLCVGAIIDLSDQSDREVTKYSGNGIKRNWKSPIYSTKSDRDGIEKKILVADPRLIMHVPQSEEFIENICPKILQLRDQLFNDLSYFIGSHLSRPGIVTVT